jgi:thioredoxin reductase (NADPH)
MLATDPDGYVRTHAPTTYPDIPGLFAAGDLVDRTYRQAITAASSGYSARDRHGTLAGQPDSTERRCHLGRGYSPW